MQKKLFIVLFLIVCSSNLFSQDVYQFSEGLILGAEIKYGREALIRDEVAYQLFTGTFKAPEKENSQFVTSDKQNLLWKKVIADSSHTFKGETLSEGYMFLEYHSDKDQTALLNVAGHSMVFFNGIPHAGDIYKYGWVYSPVQIKKGRNEILIRCSRWSRWQGITAKIVFPEKPVALNIEDATLPHLIVNETQGMLTGGIVVVNASDKALRNLSITSKINNKEISTALPSIPAMATRKVAFQFDAGAITRKDSLQCILQLKESGKVIDENAVSIHAVNQGEHYSNTFVSDIDGSVQYYSVAPQKGGSKPNSALFLSVHGTEVQAIGQARAYKPKDWGVLIAPTNRRPRGFNGEEWGRMDALEVLEIAKEKFKPDPKKIFLTGHSMGGHGTWHLGATYPEKWAAIAPCAGYASLMAYGSSDGKIPETGKSDTEDILLQAGNTSNVLEFINNYRSLGVYIHHGDSDKVVSVDYARQMRKELSAFHKDFSYYEYPGGSHWFGDESVDWPPLFDYFKWHTIPDDSTVNYINFTTANPAISSSHYWVHVLQQQQSLKFSRLILNRDINNKTIKGTTENVGVLGLSLHNFNKGDTVSVELDGEEPLEVIAGEADGLVYLHKNENWQTGVKPDPKHKGISQNGTFKEPFNHRMVFVYGTAGNKEENTWAYNKAIYDAEVWYYGGNGAVDVVADKDFVPTKYPDRGVVIYGNATTNKAWKKLLAGSPVQVNRGNVTVGDQVYKGDDLGAYFMWPRPDSEVASVAVISGSGLKGMQSTESNQYFAAGSGFPDYMVFSADMLVKGHKGIKCAGFYTNDWKLDKSNVAVQEPL